MPKVINPKAFHDCVENHISNLRRVTRVYFSILPTKTLQSGEKQLRWFSNRRNFDVVKRAIED